MSTARKSLERNGVGSPSPDLGSPVLSPPTLNLSERLSLDSERSNSRSPPNGLNGLSNGQHHHTQEDGEDPIRRLQDELERTKQEKEHLATQYNSLLGKLTTMRTSLQNKLRQDAEELERREQLVQQLTAQNDDLSHTLETLKSEVIASNEEAERASKELESMRSRAMHDNAQESMLRERELRELQSELERCRMERDEWEHVALQERVVTEEAKSRVESLKRDLEIEREAREMVANELEMEREKSNNLQSVLEDFQSAKDHELRQAVEERETRYNQVTQSLAEFKHRALTAEMQLEELGSNSSRVHDLEKEVKEKNLLIGKLRHEAVIMNEHLMEALRRLRRNSSSDNVDRRLVTNVLLSFLATPRADSKRFEMLQLLSSILNWSDAEREKAGLQRMGNGLQQHQQPPTMWGRSVSGTNVSGLGKSAELDKTDETESFSRLWVEFLLTEAGAGQPTSPNLHTSQSSPGKSPSLRNASLPGSPTHSPPHGLGPRRLPSSFASAGAMASTPNLTILGPPPSRKGKERAVEETS
ncbi:hypothetical protein JAAARDRAFT_192938 [Jaapia argillacea MUCL 33604]|uniref:GRIP domain-containing protein n=1 Tax=Jaapia argillacea MUCL 33604 TaxID=933084 RepID=A0A067PUC0_9AGAM|nr:hypothetical protein JAAARDRAFT_192938 [Jaapia argillacea MUCL 33604]